jgi:DNA ligase D-like protein (predicted 3'-phosphoesterase)
MGYLTDHNRMCVSQPYAIKLHRTQKDHLDLRLCNHELAMSWALYQMPSYCPALECGAIQVENHLRENIAFEGVHPEGIGAGPVIVVDRGIFKPEPEYTDITASLQGGRIIFTFEGTLMRGLWSLTRQKSCFRPQNPRWILRKEPDLHAQREVHLERIDSTKLRSCRTGLTIEETERDWRLGKRRFRRGRPLFDPEGPETS